MLRHAVRRLLTNANRCFAHRFRFIVSSTHYAITENQLRQSSQIFKRDSFSYSS